MLEEERRKKQKPPTREEREYNDLIRDKILKDLNWFWRNERDIPRLAREGGRVRLENSVFRITEVESEGAKKRRYIVSAHGYLNYGKPADIAEQVERLRRAFPNLRTFDAGIAEGNLPPGAEGWFAFPRREKIATSFLDAIQKVFKEIYFERKGKLDVHGDFYWKPIKQNQKTADAMAKIEQEQKNSDILVMPAQFGIGRWDLSADEIGKILPADEFSLDPYVAGIMLLTHPERLTVRTRHPISDGWHGLTKFDIRFIQYGDLGINCPGIELDLRRNGATSHILQFESGITINPEGFKIADCCYGVPTGFLW